MPADWDDSSVLAVALVTAMTDRFDGESDGLPLVAGATRAAMSIQDRQCVVRAGQMITDGKLDDDLAVDWLVAALGLLAARAIEDLATASGEPTALWLDGWLSGPYGSPQHVARQLG
jgi:hypothetical protein